MLTDTIAIAGVATIAAGLHAIYPPAAVLWTGFALLAAAVLRAHNAAAEAKRKQQRQRRAEELD